MNSSYDKFAKLKSSKFLSMGHSMATFGAMAATGTTMISPIGAVVSVAALAAKDGVVAAARKGKEVRVSRQQQQQHQCATTAIEEGGDALVNRISLNFGDGGGESSTTNNTTTIDGGVGPSNTNSTTAGPDAAGEDGYKFGDVTRGLIGTIREKRQQSQYESSRTSSTFNPLLRRPVVMAKVADAAVAAII